MSDRGPVKLDESAMVANIGCERCHGPGQAHIEAARRGAGDEMLAMPFGLGRWQAADEIQMCGALSSLARDGQSRPDPSWQCGSGPLSACRPDAVCLLQEKPGQTLVLDLPRAPRQDLDRSRRIRGGVPVVPPGSLPAPVQGFPSRPAASAVTCRAGMPLGE